MVDIRRRLRRRGGDRPDRPRRHATGLGWLLGDGIDNVLLGTTEEEQFGKIDAHALDAATEKAHQLGDFAREKKDELVEKADQSMKPSGSAGQGSQSEEPNEQVSAQQPIPAI